MSKHGFIQGIGIGMLTGAAIGVALAVSPKMGGDMRRMARKATRQMGKVKEDLTDVMGL